MKKILAWVKATIKIIFFSFFFVNLICCPTSESLYRQAYNHYLSANEKEALNLCEKIIKSDPSYTPAYILSALIKAAHNENEEAIDLLLNALNKAKPSAVVFFNLGNLYFNKKDYLKAYSQYTAALSLKPAMAEAYLNRANTLMMLNEYRKALIDYETFLELSNKEQLEVKKLVELLRNELAAN